MMMSRLVRIKLSWQKIGFELGLDYAGNLGKVFLFSQISFRLLSSIDG